MMESLAPSINMNRFKVAFVGLGGVGKSTIIRLLTDQRVQRDYKPTIGIDFGTLKMGECDVALWDLAAGRLIKTSHRMTSFITFTFVNTLPWGTGTDW